MEKPLQAVALGFSEENTYAMRGTIIIFYILLILLFGFNANAQQPAFPGAEGYGKFTKGGRGGTVIKVTNLNASGPGSFVAALQASGPRIVVFEVSGTIQLPGQVTINNPFITIAGQSAPSPGILIKGGAITIKTHDVLMQHLRVRAGNSGDDCVKISSAGTGDVYNIYLDHISASWAKDEVFSVYQRDGRIYDISVSHCFITEGLAQNNSYSGAKGFLISKDPNKSSSTILGNISVTKSLFAHNNQRNPNMKNGTRALLANNLVYGYRHSAVEIGDDVGEFMISNINNCYKKRPGVDPIKPPISLRSPYTGQLYMSGNEVNNTVPSQSSLLSASLNLVNSSPMDLSVVNILPTTQTHDYVLANAGARPVDRDAVDKRIIDEVESGQGDWMDQSEVSNAYPSLANNKKTFSISNPGGDDDGDGYTNVEELLHELKLQVEGGSSPDPEPEPNQAPTISNITNKTINQGQNLGPVAFTVGDDKTPAGSLTLSGTSSNPTLANNNDISFGGSGANRTVSISPNTGQSGSATITVTVSDGELTASDTFVLTVNAASPPPNTAPTISNINNVTINQGETAGPISFQVGDAETGAGQLTTSATSNNQTLLPNNAISISGSGANRSISLTPSAAGFGNAVITVTVSDGQLSSSDQFTLIVNQKDEEPENTPPTISGISNKEIGQDQVLGPINFTIGDAQTNPSSLTVSGSSSNSGLVPNNKISFGGSGANRNVTVTPNAGAFGVTTISISVSDGEDDVTTSFQLTVTQASGGGNQAPVISSIADVSSPVNRIVGPVYFTVSDDNTSPNQIQISVTSGNTGLIGNNQMKLQSSGASRALYLRPHKNQSGKTTITVVASDGSKSSSESFVITVGNSSNATASQSGSDANVKVISNHPNPFSNKTTITWSLDQQENVALEVFDMRGHSVKKLVNEKQSAGEHSVVWDRTSDRRETVQDGMYILRFRHGNEVVLERIVVGH